MKRSLISASLLSAALFAGAVLAQAAAPPAISPLGSSSTRPASPTRVASAPSGLTYIVDSSAGKVLTTDAFGRVVAEKTGFADPLGIAVDGAGNIYLGQAGTGEVTVFDSQWNALSQLGAGAGEFGVPAYIALDPGATPAQVYVSDSQARVVKVYRGGTLTATLGGPGSGSAEFAVPAGLWVSPSGELFAADQNNSRIMLDDRILVFSREGVFLRSFDFGSWVDAAAMGRPTGVAGDGSGRIYVADTFQDKVRVFDGGGLQLGSFGAYDASLGQLRSPAGVSIDRQGRLMVASQNTGRIESFGIDCFTSLTSSLAGQAAPVGGTVSFTAASSCSGPFTYQWRKDGNDLSDSGDIFGSTNATLTMTGVTAANAGAYSVAITGPAGTVVSPEAALTVTPAPVLVSSPVSRTLPIGASVVLSATVTGPDLTWRWFYNNLEIPAPNTNALWLTNLQLWATGRYWAMATNSAGSATTAQAQLTVQTAPYMVAGPTNVAVAEYGTASFTVSGGGAAPLQYQWYFGQTALLNQTNATMTLTNVSPAMNGAYYARVYNAVGTTNSSSATLTVQPDTVPPMALYAAGGTATSRNILVTFSEPVSAATAQLASNYELMGPGGLTVIGAVVTGNVRVLLTLSANRSQTGDYALKIRNVTDRAYTPNTMTPNPTVLSVNVSDTFGTVAWWPLNEGTGTIARDATGSGFDGTLESATWTTGRNGFSVNLDGTVGDVVVPALNLSANTVTISAWIRRSGSQSSRAGIFFTRAGNSVAGLTMGTTNELRYNWNDVSTAYNYSSGLVPPDGVWTFVALVVEPARAVFYLNSGSGWRMATNTLAHSIEEFNGISYIGRDTQASTRRFKGAIDEVRVCNRALSASEVQALYAAIATPAVCTIAAPVNGSTVPSANPMIVASVGPNGNTINKVEFWSGTTLLGSARTIPYTLVWSNLTTGSYSVQARAWYGPMSYSASSPVVNFNVAVPIITTLTRQGTNLTLGWTGALPPYQVQVATNVPAVSWQNLGGETTNTSLPLPLGENPAFYRVVGH